MADYHFWTAWNGAVPDNCNGIGDYITVVSQINNVFPTPVASWCFHGLCGWFAPKGQIVRDVELNLCQENEPGRPPPNYFVAIVDGVNKYYFKIPVVIGHRYFRELKLKTKTSELLPENQKAKMKVPACRFVLQDMTAGTMERVEFPVFGNTFTLAENFLEWHNRNEPTAWLPRFECKVDSFGSSLNGGSSYNDFVSPDSLNKTDDGSGMNWSTFLGNFIINGQSIGALSPGNVSNTGGTPPTKPKYAGSLSAGDIHFYYSGGEGNTLGDFSLGGPPSRHEVPTYALNNVFDDLSEGEAKSGSETGEYRCLYVKNVNDTTYATEVTLWSPTAGSVSPDTYLYFGVGTAPINGTEPQIANSDQAPPGVQFQEYHTYGKALVFEDLPPQGFRSFWMWRRHRANTRTFSRDQAIVEANYFPPLAESPLTPVCPEGYKFDANVQMCVRESGGTGTGSKLTGHGVKLFYNTLGGDRFFELMSMSQSNIKQVDFQKTCKEYSGTKPNIAFKLGTGVVDQVRIEVGTKSTPGNFNDRTGALALENLDTAFLTKRGYMSKPDDWRNYEATWYLLVHSEKNTSTNGGPHTELEGRCAYNSTDSTKIGNPPKDRSCESTKYNFNCYYPTGRVKFEKCLMHSNGYSATNPEKKNAMNPANWKGKWTGFKEVVYNIPGSTNVRGTGPQVKIEGYCDQGTPNTTTPSNDWKKVFEAIDDGSGKVFGPPRAKYTCGSDQLIPVSWGGPLMVFRWDFLDAEFKWLSIYELDPAIKPAGTGGQPDMLPPTWVGGNTAPKVVPVGSARIFYAGIARGTAVGQNDLDRYTVGISAQIIHIMANPQDGAPTLTNSWGWLVTVGNTYYGLAGYCAGTWGSSWVYGRYGTIPEDIAVCAYWDDYYGKCVVPGAGMQYLSKSGAKNLARDYYGPKLQNGPYIYLIFWGADWNSRTTSPTRAEIEHKVRDFLLDRDRPNYFSRLTQYGIYLTPEWGKSCVNITTPIPTSPASDRSIMQAIHDSIQRGDVDSPILHPTENCIYLVICPYNVAQIADPWEEAGSSYCSFYEYDSSSNFPGHHDASGGSTNLFRIYGQEGPGTAPRALYATSLTRYGWHVSASSIMLAQDPLTQIGFYISKVGSPTGPVWFRIRDSADNIKMEFGVLDAASDITTALELCIIRNETNQYKLQPGDRILVEYAGGSANNYIRVDEIMDNSTFEGSPTCAVTYQNSYSIVGARMPAGELWTGYTISAEIRPGTNLGGGTYEEPNEPDVLVYDVGSVNAPNNMYAGSYVRCAQTVKTTASVLYNKVPARIGHWMSKSGTPTGTVYCRIRRPNDTIAAEFGSIDIGAVQTTTMALYNFDNFQNSYALEVGSRICIEYSGGDSTNRLRSDEATLTPNYDGTDSVSSRYTTSWTDYNNNDMCLKILCFTGGVPPPPVPPKPEPEGAQPDTIIYSNIPSTVANTPVNISGASTHLQRYGLRVNSPDSMVIGGQLTEIRVRMRKVGNPTGNLTIRCRDSASNNKYTFTTTWDVTQLTTGLSSTPFQSLKNTIPLEEGDRVCVEYTGGDASNYIQVDRSLSGGPDSTHTCATSYTGTSWSVQANEDPAMSLLTTGKNVRPPPPPPPPFTVRYQVGLPPTSQRLSFSSGQRVQGQYIDTGSNLIGRVFTRLTFWVNRWSRGSGNLIATIRDSNNNVKANFGSVAVTSLKNNDNDQSVTFTNLNNKYAIAAKDFVCIEHDSANGQIDGCRGTNSVANGYVKWNNGGSSWGQSTTNDYVAIFETGGA